MRQDDVGDNVKMSKKELFPKEAQKFILEHFPRGNLVCLSGAGISAESGIPTFRGKGGLWEKYDPERYGHAEGLARLFKEDPAGVTRFIIDFYSVLLPAQPNPAHLALALFEKRDLLTACITQNIDNLHVRAGNRNCIELHGNAFRIRCSGCQKKIDLEKDRIREMVTLLGAAGNSRIRILKLFSRYFPCCKCGGRFRSDVVLFGEVLPQDQLSKAYHCLDECKVLLLIGTSLAVYPAAGLPLYAKTKGAKLIEINNEETPFSGLCDIKIREKTGIVLPEILKLLGYV